MTEKRAARRQDVSVGISTVVVMFVVIAMTIFAVLALSTARQEAELAEKYAAAVTDYWTADGLCTDAVNAIVAGWLSGGDPAELAEQAGAELRQDGGDAILTLRRDAGEHTAIEVALRLGADGASWSIERWQQVSTDEDWTPDNKLPVWKG